MELNLKDLIEYIKTDKRLYASNGEGVRFYITFNGFYEVWVKNKMALKTPNPKEAIEFFNNNKPKTIKHGKGSKQECKNIFPLQ